jgi:hypothetical protein
MSTFTISPSVSGKSTWNLSTDGDLVLPSGGLWTITPTADFSANTKIWGAGGGNYTTGNGGGPGGAAFGKISFENGVTYQLFVGNPGTSASSTRGGGGGGAASGVLRAGSTEVLIAGGGGGGSGADASGRQGGSGGGTNGSTAPGSGGGGGTQVSAGAGGVGSRRTGSSGSGTNGGRGSGATDSYSGGSVSGISGYTGGMGIYDAGDQGGGGGGGGHYGGGGGGGDAGGFGGGGGSGYYSTTYVTDVTLYNGSSSTSPGNASDSDRGTAGNGATAGKIVLSLASAPVPEATGPTVSIEVSPSFTSEDGTSNIVYSFSRANGANAITDGDVTIQFSVTGNAVYQTDYDVSGAATFSASSGTITITNGNSLANLIIDPITNYDINNTKVVIITAVNNVVGYTITETAYPASIIDDDIGVYFVGGAGNTQLEVSAAGFNYTNVPVTNITFASIETLDVSNSFNTFTSITMQSVDSQNAQTNFVISTVSPTTIELKLNQIYEVDFPTRVSFNAAPTPQTLPPQFWK